MSESEILKFLRVNPSEALDASLKAEIESSKPGNIYLVTFNLIYTSEIPYFTRKQFVELLNKEELGNGHPLHPIFNLDLLLAEKLPVGLPISSQRKVMQQTLDNLAELDPRIKGIDCVPPVKLATVGGKDYDFKNLALCYESLKER